MSAPGDSCPGRTPRSAPPWVPHQCEEEPAAHPPSCLAPGLSVLAAHASQCPQPSPPRCCWRCPRPLPGPVRWALLPTSARPAPALRADQFSLCPDPRPPPGQARGAGLGTARPDHWRSACCEPDPALGASGSLPEQVPTRGPSTWPWAWTGWAPSWLVLCGTNGALGGLVPAAAGYAAGMGGFPGEPGWGGRVRGWGRGSARGEAQLLVVPEQTDAPPATRRGQLCLGVSATKPQPLAHDIYMPSPADGHVCVCDSAGWRHTLCSSQSEEQLVTPHLLLS